MPGTAPAWADSPRIGPWVAPARARRYSFDCTANDMYRCGRTIYEQGRERIIEAARTLAGEEPAEELLARLEASGRQKDVERLADTVIVLEDYARKGELEMPRELNKLRDGLWELKAGDVRLPFYELGDRAHSLVVARLTSGSSRSKGLRLAGR